MPFRSAPIERASPNDLMELASDVGPAPMQVGAVLLLAADPGLAAVQAAIGARIPAVPRLRQRLVRVPPGCGRPVWVDDPEFDVGRQVHAVRCPPPGDETALLAVAATAVTTPLPADRPPWSATLVTGLPAGVGLPTGAGSPAGAELPGGTGSANGAGAALVVVIHHVLADGVGGLAVLASLVDGVPGGPPLDFPRPRPARRELLADALTSRARALAHPVTGLRRLGDAVTELRSGATGRVPPCSLNRPTGPRRRLAVARADLAAVRAAGHAHGGTVNDVVLAAVTGALRSVLRHRGETPGRMVASVPISARRAATPTALGNQVGVLPVELPDIDDPAGRLAAVARTTRARRQAPRGASAAVLAPAFRLLGRAGLLRRYIDRQRRVTTFVTNLRGPADRLSLAGTPVTGVLPLPATTGNVTVAFGVLSYAGTLALTVVADPDACPDLTLLVQALQAELDRLTGAGARPIATADHAD